jgi:peptidoglycan/LPS O-acetylase OafA/YrhL
MKFRSDINGLRAVAVVAVVLFHFNANWMPGGFAGVDVFFVISGFLMTSIIFRGIEQAEFSVWRFYIARANRIIPALAVVSLFLLVFGWFFTLNIEYEDIAKHIASSVLFISNIVYWNESGYFEAASHEKWLLHSWSLSVEWQFYIIYPLVLIGVNKFLPIKYVKRIVLLGVILGFAFCIFASYKWPDAAYYLLPTRAWEMMVGGVAYLYPFKSTFKSKKVLEWFGFVLILISYLFISKDNVWPGYLAMLPVLGAYLIIQTQCNDSFFLNNFIMQKIGVWSYSIYLWHWPLVVYMFLYMDDTIQNNILLISLSIFLGMLSYTYVEKRVKGEYVFLLWLVTVVASSIIFIYGANFEFRMKSQNEGNFFLNKYKNYEMDPTGLFQLCNASLQMLDNGKPQLDDMCIAKQPGGIFVWGDSHMGALSTGLRFEMLHNTPFSQLTSSGCAPSFKMKRNGTNRFDIGCDFSNNVAYDSIIKAQPRTIILGAASKHEFVDWDFTITKLHEMGVENVLIIGPFPQWQPSLPTIYVRRHMGEEFISDSSFTQSLINSNDYLVQLKSRRNDFTFINMIDVLCKMNNVDRLSCKARVGEDLIAFDYGHLTVEGSRYVTRNYVIPFI